MNKSCVKYFTLSVAKVDHEGVQNCLENNQIYTNLFKKHTNLYKFT